MSAPLNPALMPELVQGRFRFTPAIAGIEHNEWSLSRSTWPEIVVTNTRTQQEIAIPRRFVGGIFETKSGRQLALLKELESSGGRVRPRRRGVIEMRGGPDPDRPRWSRPQPGGGVVAIRVEPAAASPVRRILRGSVALGFVACLALVFVVRDARLGTNLTALAANDDYAAVVRKLGPPSADRWIADDRGGGVRRLWYPRERVAVILMGQTSDSARYSTIGNRP